MRTLTIGKILNNYQDLLTDYEIEQLKDVQRRKTDFATQVKELQFALFAEEWDFMSRESSDKGNGMSAEYTERVNKKRTAFGVSALSESGNATDKASVLFCEEVVRHTKNYTELLELRSKKEKQIVFVDMDGVLVNFKSGIDKISKEDYEKHEKDLDEVPGIFSLMEPNEGAIEAYEWLCKNFDTYILSTAPWKNPSAWIDKLHWVQKHLPKLAHKRLILSHNKHLAKGDFLIDDRKANGADKFQGKHLFFGPEEEKDFKDWKAVVAYMKNLV